MTQEFSKGSDNFNSQTSEKETITSSIFLAEITRDLKAANPASPKYGADRPPSPGGFSDSSSRSPVTSNRSGSTSGSATEANTGAVSRTTDEQLPQKLH